MSFCVERMLSIEPPVIGVLLQGSVADVSISWSNWYRNRYHMGLKSTGFSNSVAVVCATTVNSIRLRVNVNVGVAVHYGTSMAPV